MNSLNLIGTAVCWILVPAVVLKGGAPRPSGRLLMYALFAAMGLCQGPSIPTLGQLNKDWCPEEGAERSWALRIQGLAHNGAPALATGITPWIVKRYGWAAVFYVYGAVASVASAMWVLCASNSAKGDAIESSGSRKSEKCTEKIVEWGIFEVSAVQTLIVHQFASNHLLQIMSTWAPVYYVEALGCNPIVAGSLLAASQVVNIPASFLCGIIETWMLHCKYDVLTVRKAMTIGGSLVETASVLVYGLVSSPIAATIAYAAMNAGLQAHQSGAWALMYETGGKDVATLSSVSNTLGNTTGILVPFMGVWLRSRFNSWFPHILFAVALKMIAAAHFGLLASAKSARVLLAEQHSSTSTGGGGSGGGGG
jgi:sugar phosphate permease